MRRTPLLLRIAERTVWSGALSPSPGPVLARDGLVPSRVSGRASLSTDLHQDQSGPVAPDEGPGCPSQGVHHRAHTRTPWLGPSPRPESTVTGERTHPSPTMRADTTTMATQRLISRLCHEGGFRMLPPPNSTGFDDGLLFYRQDATGLDLVTAWSDSYAVLLRVPPYRDMRTPFTPSPAIRRHVGTFGEIVRDLIEGIGRHGRLLHLPATGVVSEQGASMRSGTVNEKEPGQTGQSE